MYISLMTYICENIGQLRYIWKSSGCRNWFDSAEDYKLFFRGELKNADILTNKKGKEYCHYLFNDDIQKMERFIDSIFSTSKIKEMYFKVLNTNPVQTNLNIDHLEYSTVAPFIFGDKVNNSKHRKIKHIYSKEPDIWAKVNEFKTIHNSQLFIPGNGSIKQQAAFNFETEIKEALENYIKSKLNPELTIDYTTKNYQYAENIFKCIPKYLNLKNKQELIDLLNDKIIVKIPKVQQRQMVQFEPKSYKILVNYNKNTGEELADVQIITNHKNINISLKDTKNGGYTLCNIGIKKLLNLSNTLVSNIDNKFIIEPKFLDLLYALGFNKDIIYESFIDPSKDRKYIKDTQIFINYKNNIKNLIIGALGKDYILLESTGENKKNGEICIIPNDEEKIKNAFAKLDLLNIQWWYPYKNRKAFKIYFQTNLFDNEIFNLTIRHKKKLDIIGSDETTLGFGPGTSPSILIYLNKKWNWNKIFKENL